MRRQGDESAQPPDDVDRLAEAAEKPVRGHGLMRGFVLGAVVTAAMALFIVQNTASIEFDWLWLEFEAPLWLMLLVAFAAGLIVGPLVIAGWRRASRERARRRRLVAEAKQSRTGTSESQALPEA